MSIWCRLRIICFVYLQTYWTNKNNKLYHGSSSSNIDWLHRLWKRWSCFVVFLNTLKKHDISCQRSDQAWWRIELKDKLYQKTEKLSLILSHVETLFVTLDTIAEESPDKQRQSLTELATTSKHHNHYLWLLTQSYSDKAMFIWYLNRS